MRTKKKVSKQNKFEKAVLGTPDTIDCYKEGLQALTKAFKAKIILTNPSDCDGSVELDECVLKKYPQNNRWDYIIGYNGKAYFIEFHSANTGEVSVMLKKLQWLKDWLHNHAPEINKIKATEGSFIWIQSNGNHILKGSAEERRIAQNGLKPVSRLELK